MLLPEYLKPHKVEEPKPEPPVISTPWGPVTESARRQAALNMRDDLALRAQVLAMVVKECGGDTARGEAEFRRRYPETGL